MVITVERLEDGTRPKHWTPIVGEVTKQFVSRKLTQPSAPNQAAMDKVVNEAVQILSHCTSPEANSKHDAGLVVGYVQSGKTLSFTTVAALARDNRYAAVVVLAGTAVNLKNQSENRIINDLGLEGFSRDWKHFENPVIANDSDDIQKVIFNWKKQRPVGSSRAVLKPSLLITVLKHHGRIDNLTELLKHIQKTVDLKGAPFLIIDDESDQASLNTSASKNLKKGLNEKSTTYERILDLRNAIPHHTYLQYTATPQANLLIGLMDVLSPSFVELLSSGDAYIGGKYFFQQNKSQCISIPLDHVPTDENPLQVAPTSLQEALRFFLIGAANHYISDNGPQGNRSMMVHPSQKTSTHYDYKQWIDGLITQWSGFLEESETSLVRITLKEDFRKTYDQLSLTFGDLLEFDLLFDCLTDVLEELKVVKVNSKKDGERDVKWKKNIYWILVGGQKLDRGFTVEGLTVTYMPRQVSANADTLQQRARFFGYKKSYAGLCRIFLLQDAIDAFQSYVESEEFVRKALMDLKDKPLKEWKRDFILDSALNPTRQNVIGRRVEKIALDEGWVVPTSLFKDRDAVLSNKALFLRQALMWKQAYPSCDASKRKEFRDKRKDSSRNILIEGIPVESVLNFLMEIQIKNIVDSKKVTAIALSLAHLKENNSDQALVDVFLIGELNTEGLKGRELKGGKINNLFVGSSPKGAKSLEDLIYVGDRALHTQERVSLHLRMLKFLHNDLIDQDIADSIPWFAVWLPEAVAQDCIIEEL